MVVGIELVHGVRDVLGDLVVVGFFGWGGSGCAVYLGGEEGGDVWGVERGASVTGGGWWAGGPVFDNEGGASGGGGGGGLSGVVVLSVVRRRICALYANIVGGAHVSNATCSMESSRAAGL